MRVQTAAQKIQVSLVQLTLSKAQNAYFHRRMGELERKLPVSPRPSSSTSLTRTRFSLLWQWIGLANKLCLVGVARHIPLHAMCCIASQAWNSHIQGQVLEYG